MPRPPLGCGPYGSKLYDIEPNMLDTPCTRTMGFGGPWVPNPNQSGDPHTCLIQTVRVAIKTSVSTHSLM